MKRYFRFGEHLPGYTVPVFNEREVRAAAGLLFLIMLTSAMPVIARGETTLLKYSVTLFFLDFVLRVFAGPAFSPSLIIGQLIVRHQTPEYVGAPQKYFAWTLGLILSAVMVVLLVLLNHFGTVTGIICVACMTFLFFESAFGICLGCHVYRLFHTEPLQYCSGDYCSPQTRRNRTPITSTQLATLIGFACVIALLHVLFNDYFQRQPLSLLTTPPVHIFPLM